jgi:hypothetical protein
MAAEQFPASLDVGRRAARPTPQLPTNDETWV